MVKHKSHEIFRGFLLLIIFFDTKISLQIDFKVKFLVNQVYLLIMY